MVHMDKGAKKKGLDFIGACVDSLFLSIPRTLKLLKPKRDIDRATYERQIDYYIDKGYTDNQETFFTFPEKIQPYSMIVCKPYYDGMYQVYSYPSGYETKSPLLRERYNSYESNRTGYIVRWTHGDKGRNTVLCLHGYMLGDPGQAEKMFKVHKLYSMGLDVALFIAPFHWKRAPASRALRGIYLQPDDVAMTCECVGQTMYDLYSSFLILKESGAGETGIIGASMGGYNAALFICLTQAASFAAMMVPAVNYSQPFGPDSIKLSFPVDTTLRKKINAVWEFHSPLNMSPKIPKERIMFIASRGDRICPFEYVRMLCEKWDWPKYHFHTGGHWLVFNRKARGKAWYSFLDEMGFVSEGP